MLNQKSVYLTWLDSYSENPTDFPRNGIIAKPLSSIQKIMKSITDIFDDEPSQWGLRGDPYVWKKLKSSFTSLNGKLTQEKFEEELERQFNKIIKQSGRQTSNEVVWFESFPQMGLSGGSISLKWWKETGLPLIKSKYENLNKD